MKVVTCARCSNEMQTCKIIGWRREGCGCLVVLVGIAAALFVAESIPGIILVAAGLYLTMSRKRKVWQCQTCGKEIPCAT